MLRCCRYYQSFIVLALTVWPPVCGSNTHPTRHHHTERGNWNLESDQNHPRLSLENFQFLEDLSDLQAQINQNHLLLNLTNLDHYKNLYSGDENKSSSVKKFNSGEETSRNWLSELLSNYSSEEKVKNKKFYKGDLGNPYSRYYFSFNSIDKNKSLPELEGRGMGDWRTSDVRFPQGPLRKQRKLDSFENFGSTLFEDKRRSHTLPRVIKRREDHRRSYSLPKMIRRREEDRESMFMRHNITVETLNKRSDHERNLKVSTQNSSENNSPENDSTWNISFSDKSTNLNNTGTKIYAQVGGDALLPCRVGHLGDRQVSWIRRRDWYVLTSGEALYTHDDRFVVLHEAGSQDWTLHIKRAVKGDSGVYECQVSTGTGIISFFVRLEVVTPKAHISGNGRTHVYRGSPFTILCYIVKSPSAIQHVMWYHNGNYLNYKRERTDIKITTKTQNSRHKDDDNNEEISYEEDDKLANDPDKNVVVSRLKVEFATEEHSGNYTCGAPNVMSDSTLIYVTEGDKTAAVQRIDSKSSRNSPLPNIVFLIAFSALTAR